MNAESLLEDPTKVQKITVERWEADEFVIVVNDIGVVGSTLSRKDAEIVSRWLASAINELTTPKW